MKMLDVINLLTSAAGIAFSGTSLGRRTMGTTPLTSSAPAAASTAAAPTAIGAAGARPEGHLAALSMASDDEGVDGHLGLGELAQLTVNNEAEVSYDVRLHLLFIFLKLAHFYHLTSSNETFVCISPTFFKNLRKCNFSF